MAWIEKDSCTNGLSQHCKAKGEREKDKEIQKYTKKKKGGEERKERRERKKGREMGGRKKDKLFDKRLTKEIMVYHTVEYYSFRT